MTNSEHKALVQDSETALLVRVASVLAFVAQSAFLWFTPTGERDLGILLLFAVLGSGFLIPLTMARAAKPALNLALLIGFIPAAVGTIWVVTETFGATNSTAALGILVLPFVQGVCFTVALIIGFAEEKGSIKIESDSREP